MNFAILGTDVAILQLAQAAQSLGHDIAWWGDVRTEDRGLIGQLVAAPPEDRMSEWELLLDQGTVDGVLVGRGGVAQDVRADQLKRLAAATVPLLTSQPVVDSVLPYYEIDMTRRETGGLIQHFNSVISHTAAQRFLDWVRGSRAELGTIQQLVCERQVPGVTRDKVLSAFTQDVEVMAAIAGNIRRVSAVGPASADSSFVSLQVQMTASGVPSLRWSVAGVGSRDELVHFTVVGDRGSVRLREMITESKRPNAWQLETVINDQRETQLLDACDPAVGAIERFAAAIGERDATRRTECSTWEAATRAMEVVDAVELSLQKGRTIEVFQQQLTERLAFRGTMAAFGCGLLLLVFFAVLVIAVLGGAEGIMQEKIAPAWPLMLLAGLAFFLLLQAVPFLVSKKDRSKPPS